MELKFILNDQLKTKITLIKQLTIYPLEPRSFQINSAFDSNQSEQNQMNKTQKIVTSEQIDGASPFRGSFQSHTSPFKMTAKLGPQILNCHNSDNLSSSQQTVIKNMKPSVEKFNQTIQLTKDFDISDNTLKGADRQEALSQLSQSLKTVEILRQSIIDKIQLNSRQNSVQSLSRKNSNKRFDLSETQQTLKVNACEDYEDNIDLPLQITCKPQKQLPRDRSPLSQMNQFPRDKSPITTIKLNTRETQDSATVEKKSNNAKKDRTSQSKQNVSRVLGNLCKTSAIMDQILSGGNFKNQRNSSLKRNNFAYSSFQNEVPSVNKQGMSSKTQLNNFGVQIRKFELNSNEKQQASNSQLERKRRPISIEKSQKLLEKDKKPDTLATYRSKESQIRKPQFMERQNSKLLALNIKKQNLKRQDTSIEKQRLKNQIKNKSQDNIILQRKPAVPLQNKGVRFSIQGKISPQRALQRSFSKVLDTTKSLNRHESNTSLTRVRKMTASRSFVMKQRNTQSELNMISDSSHLQSIDNAQETQKEMFRRASEKALIKQRGLKKQLDQISNVSKSRTRDQDQYNDPSVPSYMRPLIRQRSNLKMDSSQNRSSMLKSISNQKLKIDQKYQIVNLPEKSPKLGHQKRLQQKNPIGISAQVKILKESDLHNIHTQSISSQLSTSQAQNEQLQSRNIGQQNRVLFSRQHNFETGNSTQNIQITDQDSQCLPSKSQSFQSIHQKQMQVRRPKIVLNSHFDQLVESRILSPPSGGSAFSLGTQFTKKSYNLYSKSNLTTMPQSLNPYVKGIDQRKSLSKVRKSIIDLTENDDENLVLNTQETFAPTMDSSTPKGNSNIVPPSFIKNSQNQAMNQKYARSSSVLHLNLTDQFSGKILMGSDAQKSSRRNQQSSTRGYMAQTYSSSQAPLQRSQSNLSFANVKYENQPSHRNPYAQTSSRILKREQRNSDKLELLRKARELGNKYSEKIAEEVRSRSKKVSQQQREFESLLFKTSNISSPEKEFQPQLYNHEFEGTANIEINILDPEIKLDASVLPEQQQSPEKAQRMEPKSTDFNFLIPSEVIKESRFERKRRSSKEVLRQKRLQLEKKDAQKQAQKQRFQRLQLSLRYLNMNLGAVILGYKTRRIYFNSAIIRKHRIEYRDLIQFAFMLQTEINQLKGQMSFYSKNTEQFLQDLDITQETLRVTLIEMKKKREIFQADFAKLNNTENSQWMSQSLPREVQDILYEQASKFQEARNSYQARKQYKLEKIRKEKELQNYNEISQNEDLDNVMNDELTPEAAEFERRYQPLPISQSPKKKHVFANKQELSLITEQFSPEMRQDSVSQHDLKNVSYNSPQHNRQTIQSKLKHSIISQGSKQRASKFESKIPRIDSSNRKSHCSAHRSNRSRSNIKSRIPTINVSKAQQSQNDYLQEVENFNTCQKFDCDTLDNFNPAPIFNGAQLGIKNEEATGLRNDLNNNLEMSLLKLEASNSFLEGKDCDISRIEKFQSNQDLISPNNLNNYNFSRQANDMGDGNSFKLSPCKMGQNETQSAYIYTSFDYKNNKQAIAHILNKSPKKKAQSKACSPFKKSPLKKVKQNNLQVGDKKESPEKENSIFFTQNSQISIKTGRRSRVERGSSKVQSFNYSGNHTNRISTSRDLNGSMKQATKRAQITSSFITKEVPFGFEGHTPKNVHNKTTVFSERFDMSSPEKSRSPIKKCANDSPCKEFGNSTKTLTQIQEILMQLQEKKGEKVESEEKENFKKLLGNLQMQFESLIDK